MTERTLGRRSLLATATATTGSALAGCSALFSNDDDDDDQEQPADSPTGRADRLERYPRLRVGAVDDLSEGDVDTFTYPLEGTSNFLTRIDGEAWGGVGPDASIVAYNSLCTHMGCGVEGQVKPDQEMAGPCPCHYTTFDLSKGGLVVSGAATTDLPQVRLEVEDGDIYATGIDGLVYGSRHNLRDGDPIETETED
ncbi:arsenite oxidase small subunit [Halobiforma lacisalsi AJ5]|uniref:Arsenite oxidase small subunit n=1 Tax=Natronobacterium lacisalsi AJ5 TaxID=358396 RepID=M0LKQ3_NATLA|nr:arsenate reductase (azurin) small subunit [Halobiforma lacisalsi]APW98714.1 arsenite oxidase small subunit [Halobiforma lacisalsi AJ5]EMA32585.1 arsenite oxidase small subunit AoxA [Halobiforma lacisalsi AJ5]